MHMLHFRIWLVTRFMAAFAAFAAFAIAAAIPVAAARAAPAAPQQTEGTETDPALSAEAAAVIAASANTAAPAADALPPELLDPAIAQTELEHRLVPLTRAELVQLSEAWLEIVRSKTEEVMEAEVAIDRSEGEVQGEVREQLTESMFQRNALFERFSLVLASWERKSGGSEEDAAKIAEYRAYRDAVTLDELRTSELRTIYAEALRWLTDRDGGVQLLSNIVIIIICMLALWIVASIARRFALHGLAQVDGVSRLLRAFLATTVFWMVLASGLIIAFSLIGIDITPVFALIGAASFILAFAFQETLGNIASGIMIMINRPFDEGDSVDLGGVMGTVKSFSIIATRIVTFDNQVIVIPNRNVWGNIIRNLTASETRRVDLIFGIGYRDSIEDAAEVLEQLTRAHPAVLETPEPIIRVQELAETSVNFICRPWVRTDDYWTVYWDLTQQVKQAFDARDISIPFPQRDVHLHIDRQADLSGLTGAKS